MTTIAKETEGIVVLRRIPYKVYAMLCRDSANRHVKMTYNDGTLELVSPIFYEHEQWSRRLDTVIRAVTGELRIAYRGSGSTTFRRGGEAVRKGKGKEPDQSYYFAHSGQIANKTTIDLDAGDPPPDLWIEVDNRASSKGRLPVYAGLGVPEVWRFRAKTKALTFLRLNEDGHYASIDRSLSLPPLTSALVLEALDMGGDGDEMAWDHRVRAFFREKFAPRPDGG